jgi:hypothetical protein
MTYAENESVPTTGMLVPTKGEFVHDDAKFVFEPPVKIGEHVIDSLGKLAAVAAKGFEADDQTIDGLAQETNHTLDMLYELNGISGFSQYLTNVASRRSQHAVFISKF